MHSNVGLISGTVGGTQTGSAACSWTGSAGNNGGTDYMVTAELIGNYGGSDSADVNVHLPSQTNFITGGGYIVLTQNEAGAYAGDAGSKANYGMNVKYNKSGTSLQGNVNIIVRKTTQDGKKMLYQFKSNSLIQLDTDVNSGTATFTSKGNGQWWYSSTPSIH